MYKKHKQYRLYNFDYAQNGYYFITVVTKNREHFFGKITDQQMILSQAEEYLKSNILRFCVDDSLQNPYHNNPYFINNTGYLIGITEWQILPNHIHLIIEKINQTEKAYTAIIGLNPLVKGSVSSFVNHFKGNVKKWCNDNGLINFNWQSRFHDRVIRNNAEYDRIANYIQNNVLN